MSVFLSYCRRDADELAKQLRDDLLKEGIKVWWDQASMDSRGLSFLQEIRDAIASAERLMLLLTPGALDSTYVASEWQFAAESCIAITPVLLSVRLDSIPPALADLHAVDFRPPRPYASALDELKRILGVPAAPLGNLFRVPPLPTNHIPSPQEVTKVRELVCGDLKMPIVITSTRQTSALQGMGGIGKTVLATEFARKCETRRAFPDGVIWLRFGASVDNTLSNLELVRSVFVKPESTASRAISPVSRINELLADRICLLVLDDVWRLSDIEPFTGIAGSRVRILITTRDASIITSLAVSQLSLDVFTRAKSAQLLAEWSCQPVADLPPECAIVAGECGHLPFALAVCGALARANVTWRDILAALQEADLEYLSAQLPHYPYVSVFRSIKVSVDQLMRDLPLAVDLFYELGVFRPDRPFPESAILTMWQAQRQLSDRDARKLLGLLIARSLVLSTDAGFSLHDLALDYIKASAPSFSALGEKLLQAYSLKSVEGWHSGPRDGYFFEALPYHLSTSGRSAELASLLSDYRWLYRKLTATSPASLLEDFRWVHADSGHDVIATAIKLSSHRLGNPDLLSGQLAGRLQPGVWPAVDELLNSISRSNPTNAIMPTSVCLADTTSHLKFTANVSSDSIESIAIAPDRSFALISSGTSGSVDPQAGGLFAIDVTSGERLYSLLGHTFDIYQVAIDATGRRGLSASRDGTVRVWDLVARSAAGVFSEDQGEFEFVATNGQFIIAGRDNSSGIRGWNSSTGEQIKVPHLEYARAVAAAGPHAFALHRSTLVYWRIEEPSEVLAIADGVEAFDVSTDGSSAVTLADDGKLSLWDVHSNTLSKTMADGDGPDSKTYHYIRFSTEGYVVSLSGEWEGDHASVMRLWRVADGRVMLRESGHTTLVTALASSQGSGLVITGTLDGEVKVWDLDPIRVSEETQPSPASGFIRAICIRQNDSAVVTLGEHGALNLFHPQGLDHLTDLPAVQGDHDSILPLTPQVILTYSSRGTTMVVADYDRGLTRQYSLDATALAPDADRRFVWSASRRHQICRWRVNDLVDSREPQVVTAYTLPYLPNALPSAYGPDPFSTLFPMDIAISPNGREGLVTWGGSKGAEFQLGGWQFPVALFQTDGGEITFVKPFGNHVVKRSVFCEDGESVLSATYGRVLKWSVRDQQSELNVPHETSDVFFVAVLPDGATAVSVTAEGEIRVWSTATGQANAVFFVDRILTAAALTIDGLSLIVAIRNAGIHRFRLPTNSQGSLLREPG